MTRKKIKSTRALRKQLREAKHLGETPVLNNPVAKHMNEFNKPKTHDNEKRKIRQHFSDWERGQDWDDARWDEVQPHRFYPSRK